MTRRQLLAAAIAAAPLPAAVGPAEGPVWFGDGRFPLFSDIPNDRIMRWDEETGCVSVFRRPANNSNGNTRDRQGRLVTCERLGRRVTQRPNGLAFSPDARTSASAAATATGSSWPRARRSIRSP